jgi:hypothetical protein
MPGRSRDIQFGEREVWSQIPTKGAARRIEGAAEYAAGIADEDQIGTWVTP